MSRRARYDGPHDEVAVFDPEGSVYDPPIAVVKRGGLLPADAPARVRDSLLHKDNPYWSEVSQADHKTEKKDE